MKKYVAFLMLSVCAQFARAQFFTGNKLYQYIKGDDIQNSVAMVYTSGVADRALE